jgi:hypothetical protein
MLLTVETEVYRGSVSPPVQQFQHRSHADFPGIEPGPVRWKAGDVPSKAWQGTGAVDCRLIGGIGIMVKWINDI